MPALDPRLPVLVGVGQVTHRQPPAPEPAELLAEAARLAAEDAGDAGLLRRLDAVRVVNLLTRTYPDAPGLVAGILGASPRLRTYTTPGGQTPQVLVDDTAAAIARGELDVALIGGAECWRTRSWYRKVGERPPWPDQPADATLGELLGPELVLAGPDEESVGLGVPVQYYPMFETALAIADGRGMVDQVAGAASLWEDMAAVAAGNPHAAIRSAPGAAEIATPGPTNRMIGYPYTKLLCSNNAVDQAAALLMCSVGAAEAAGVARDRWVFLHAGAWASDVVEPIRRPHLAASPAIAVVGRTVLDMAGIGVDDVDLVDLYSCFPSAVQVAVRELGLGDRRQLSVTGGLTFAGGPWNDYVTHAIATMATRLREAPGSVGLVTANGGHLTKHAAGIYSTAPPPSGQVRVAHPQAEVDAAGSRPVDAAHSGPASLEGFTVAHDREGVAEVAWAFGLTPGGARTVGAARDPDVLAALEAEVPAEVTFGGDGTFALAG